MYPLAMNVPPSPPDTNAHYTSSPVPPHPHRHFTGLSSMSAGVPDSASVLGPPIAGTETPVSRVRRQPSIFYNSNQGYRTEQRERTPSLSSRLLVVVVPPASVIEEHGTLGTTLSSGPAHRLSQGIIMPLSPNMSGQLMAIAKEFSFPSVVGLCLYYVYHDAGITMAPRLSEEVWSTIWGLSDVHSQARDKRPPIVGRLEFDIDTGRAKWYTAWLSSRQRETLDYTFYQGPSVSAQHFRGDSRYTFPQSVVTDDFAEPIQQRSAPVARHVPRKLSLVERFDTGSVHGADGPSHSFLPVDSANGNHPVSSHVLSPIKQQEEPKSARAELDNKVNTWRATAIASPEPFEDGTVSKSNFLPASEKETTSVVEEEEPLRLEDYQWSISSAGPDDVSFMDGTEYRAPSIHLDNRVNGSVASTPSYCTSFGPSDYSIYFPMADDSRLPSPDIAYRMYEDSPPTPMTATSWGAPSVSWHSLASDDYQPSIDIAHRGYFSRPSTPGTATSWGPESYDGQWAPDSPRSAYSINMADRGEFSRPVTPMTSTSWGPSTGPSSPLSPYRLPTPDIGHRGFEDVAKTVLDRWPGRPWRHAWPYNSHVQTASQPTSRLVPVISQVIKKNRIQRTGQQASAGYPHFNLYPAEAPVSQHSGEAAPGYPDFVLYPPVSKGEQVAPSQTLGYPDNLYHIYDVNTSPKTGRALIVKSDSELKLMKMVVDHWKGTPWRHAWPYNRRDSPKSPSSTRWTSAVAKVTKAKSDARLSLTKKVVEHWQGKPWRHAWPYNRREAPKSPASRWFPAVSKVIKHNSLSKMSASSSPTSASSVHYPHFNLYPPVYPFNLQHIYPHDVCTHNPLPTPREVSSVVTKSQYPYFDLYPAVYPFSLDAIYPRMNSAVVKPSGSKVASSSKSQYPWFEIYPAVYPFNLNHIYPRIHSSPEKVKVPVTVPQIVPSAFGYPYLEIYRPVYPYNLDNIYPRVTVQLESQVAKRQPVGSTASLNAGYPYFRIYPAVYPSFDLYPSVAGEVSRNIPAQLATKESSSVNAGYPYFVLYPAVYPHFNLYPAVAGSQLQERHSSSRKADVIIRAASAYPHFDLYPAVYPYFNLYPPVAGSQLQGQRSPARKEVDIRAALTYPYFNLYPAVYPHFNLYPSLGPIVQSRRAPPPAPVANSIPIPEFKAASLAAPVVAQAKRVTWKEGLIDKGFEECVRVARKESSERPARLTHAELHARVMMEQGRSRMWMEDVLQSFPSVPKGNPSGNLSRSASLSISPREMKSRRPLTSMPPPPGPLQLNPENGFGRLPSGAPRLSRASSLAQRRSMWEGNPSAEGLPPVSRPALRTEPRRSVAMPRRDSVSRRDSVVLQRVRAFGS